MCCQGCLCSWAVSELCRLAGNDSSRKLLVGKPQWADARNRVKRETDTAAGKQAELPLMLTGGSIVSEKT